MGHVETCHPNKSMENVCPIFHRGEINDRMNCPLTRVALWVNLRVFNFPVSFHSVLVNRDSHHG